MNVRPDLPMSKGAFIEWNAAEEERCELVGGRVVMMPRPSLAHGMIVMTLTVLLRTRLDPKQWVVVAEFGIDSGDVAVSRSRRRLCGRFRQELHSERACRSC